MIVTSRNLDRRQVWREIRVSLLTPPSETPPSADEPSSRALPSSARCIAARGAFGWSVRAVGPRTQQGPSSARSAGTPWRRSAKVAERFSERARSSAGSVGPRRSRALRRRRHRPRPPPPPPPAPAPARARAPPSARLRHPQRAPAPSFGTCRSCSVTWSASPHSPRNTTPKKYEISSPVTSSSPEPSSTGTAASWRSSSATPSWPSGALPSRRRTTPSGRSAPASSSSRPCPPTAPSTARSSRPASGS